MKLSLLPSAVTGHGVTNASLVSLGQYERYLAFTVSANILAITECSSKTAFSLSDSSTVFCAVEDPTREVISAVRVHDEKDLLCVGTEEHGIYMTSITSPELSNKTRIPLQFTGERIFTVCFLSVPAPLFSNTKGAVPHSKTGDLLIISSDFKKHSAALPHRLSLWNIKESCLLWRGPMAAMTAISAFPMSFSFIGCSRTTISLFTIRRSDSLACDSTTLGSTTLPRDTQRSRKDTGVTLLNRVCDTVEVLKGAEYVDCAAYTDPKDCFFLALTATGFLVAFDRFTGAIIRWMDCKINPARSMSFAGRGNFILIVGALARFFMSKNWAFCGRVKPETTVARGLPSDMYFTVGVSVGSCAILFLNNSGYSVQYFIPSSCGLATSTVPAATTNTALCGTPQMGTRAEQQQQQQGHKLRFHQKSFCCPVHPDEFQEEQMVQWIRPSPSPSPHGTWCLWTPKYIRLYSPKLFLRKQIAVNSSTAVYHPTSCVLLSYEVDNAELVAYAGRDEWRPATSLPQVERLDSLCVDDSTDFCAGYCQANSSVYAFSSRWSTSSNSTAKSLDLVPLWVRHFDTPGVPLKRFFLLESRLYGSTQNSLVELESNRLHGFEKPTRTLCVVGTSLLILRADGCVCYTPNSGSLKVLECRLSSPEYVAYEPVFGLTAVADVHEIYVTRLTDGVPFWRVKHYLGSRLPSSAVIRAIALHADTTHVTLSVLDSEGNLTEYALKVGQMSRKTRSYTLRAGSGTTRGGCFFPIRDLTEQTAGQTRGARLRALSEGAPTNRQLKDRLAALTGFYAEHKKHHSLSSRGRSIKRAALTRSSSRDHTDDRELPPSSGEAEIATEDEKNSPQNQSDARAWMHESGGCDQTKALLLGGQEPAIDVGFQSAIPDTTYAHTPLRPAKALPSQRRDPSLVSGSVMVEVSALTIPGDTDEITQSCIVNTDLHPKDCIDTLARDTACAQGSLNSADLKPMSAVEDTVNDSFTGLRDPSAHLTRRNAVAEPRDNHREPSFESFSSMSTLRLSEHTRQLRKSLENLNELLSQADLCFDQEDDNELSRLPSLLDAVATTVQSCRARRFNDSSTNSSSSTISNVFSKDCSEMLLRQMQLIQEQTIRLGRQNEFILEKLSGKGTK